MRRIKSIEKKLGLDWSYGSHYGGDIRKEVNELYAILRVLLDYLELSYQSGGRIVPKETFRAKKEKKK